MSMPSRLRIRPRNHQLIGATLLAIALVLASSAVAATSTSGTTNSTPTPTATTAKQPPFDPTQILRYSDARVSGAISPVNFDPVQFRVNGSDFEWGQAVYSTLLRPLANGSLVPELATSVKVVNPERIDITLRKGVVFSDGTPFNADAVKFGLTRNLNTKNKAGFHAQFYDVDSIDITGRYTLTVNLNQPVAGYWYTLLGDDESFIVSPTAANNPAINLNVTPVGAGPFKLIAYDPTQRMTFRKNPTYWNAKGIKLAGLELVNVNAGPQQVNSLRTNQTELEYALSPDDLASLHGTSFKTTSISIDGNMLWMPMCKANPPFDNLQVRQAVNYATDRQSIIKGLLGGKGQVMDALWPPNDVNFPKDLTNSFPYNVAKAKQLLASAGYPNGFSTTLMPLPGNPISTQVAQVIQLQWAKVGINVTIVPTTNFVPDFYTSRKAQLGLNYTMQTGMTKLNGPFAPGNIGDACQYSNAVLNKISANFNAAQQGNRASIANAKIAQRFIVHNALSVFIAWLPFNAAWNPLLQNVQFIARSRPVPDLWALYFKPHK